MFKAGIIMTCLAATSPAHEAGPVGTYRVHATDVASELALHPDGTFTYFLSAGSLDEHAEGRWRVDGPLIRLETVPKPVPATFSVGVVKRTMNHRLEIHVVGPNGSGIAAVDVEVTFDAGDPVTGYTQDYGWTLSDGEARIPHAVQLSVPIHGLRSQRFPIDISAGNDLTFVLTPNDLGTLDMADITLEPRPGQLVMRRNGEELEFSAVGD